MHVIERPYERLYSPHLSQGRLAVHFQETHTQPGESIYTSGLVVGYNNGPSL